MSRPSPDTPDRSNPSPQSTCASPSIALASRAFRHAYARARSHYENFPVVSRLLPRDMHEPIFVLYGYCRAVDDLGDEFDGPRLEALDAMEQAVTACHRGTAPEPLHPLQQLIHDFRLPLEPFLHLIEANRMDQRRNRYDTFAELLEYCRHSANPVGRLFLALFGYRDDERFALSDAVCSGLQLTNFWQDVARDFRQNRLYIPREDMDRFGYTEADLRSGTVNDAFRALMAFQVQRARTFFDAGRPLLPLLSRPVARHAGLFVEGGEYILRRIEGANFDVLSRRPTLPAWRKGWMIVKTAVGDLLSNAR